MTVDPGYVEMAGQTMALVGPYLSLLAGKAAEGTAAQAGKNVYEWLKGKFTGGAAAEALRDAREDPADETNLKLLAAQIEKAAKKDESFRRELAELLRAAGVRTGDVTANVQGDGNDVVQAVGRDIKVNIKRG